MTVNGKPAGWEVLEFVVQPVLVRKDADGEIVEKLRPNPSEVGGVRKLADYARLFPSYLREFNEAQEQAAVAAAEPVNRAGRRQAPRKRGPAAG